MFLVYPIFFLAYIVAAERLNFKKVSFRVIFGLFVLANFITLFLPSVSSDDLSSYIFWSRIFSNFGANPYTGVYDSFGADPLYPALATVWSGKPSVYGPLFTLFGSGLTFLAGDSLFFNFFFFKFAFAVMLVLTAWLIYKITRSKLAFFLFAANPVIIWELMLDRHNEIVLIFLLVLSLAAKNYLKGWVALFLSMLVKFTTLLLLPLYGFFVLKDPKQKRFRFVVTAGLLALGLGVATHLPFWAGGNMYARMGLVSRAQYPYPSPGILILSSFLPFASARVVSRMVFLGLYVLTVTRFAVLKKISQDQFVRYALFVLTAFFGFYLTLVLPWYLTTLVALTAVSCGFKAGFSRRALLYLVSFAAILLHFLIV